MESKEKKFDRIKFGNCRICQDKSSGKKNLLKILFTFNLLDFFI